MIDMSRALVRKAYKKSLAEKSFCMFVERIFVIT